MKQFILDRHKELADLATRRGIDWSARIDSLPQDDILRVVALATLLRLDGRDAVDPNKSLTDVAAQGDEDRLPGLAYLEQLLLHGTTNK
jgi:hypothetical protein